MATCMSMHWPRQLLSTQAHGNESAAQSVPPGRRNRAPIDMQVWAGSPILSLLTSLTCLRASEDGQTLPADSRSAPRSSSLHKTLLQQYTLPLCSRPQQATPAGRVPRVQLAQPLLPCLNQLSLPSMRHGVGRSAVTQTVHCIGNPPPVSFVHSLQKACAPCVD